MKYEAFGLMVKKKKKCKNIQENLNFKKIELYVITLFIPTIRLL